jgi:H(+)-translocating pyrophosphatase
MEVADQIILASGAAGLLFSYYQYTHLAHMTIKPQPTTESTGLRDIPPKQTQLLFEVYSAISEGADTFLIAEYKICATFVVFFAALLFCLISMATNSTDGMLTTISFLTGAITSMVAGYIGMKVAVFSNARCTKASAQNFGEKQYTATFNLAFRAGGCMGFCLCSVGILVLWGLLQFLTTYFDVAEYDVMMDCLSGYGLGGSCIAMFGRVGGGIYTKAADVGADLVGKCDLGIPEDDPRNPATIADLVGDNVGDVAGMSSDLFGSFAEATCAALVIAASSVDMRAAGWSALMYPVCISAVGIFVCLLTSFVATDIKPVRTKPDIEFTLKLQLIITSFAVVIAVVFLSDFLLPASFVLKGVAQMTFVATPAKCSVCVCSGTMGGLAIGLVTEYYTSHSYAPVREVAMSCKQGGAATNIIYGLALGYLSTIIPIVILAGVVFTSFTLCDTYGVALAALGMLSTLATGLTVDGFGPVADNAGGIAEMSEMEEEVRECTDALDAAGNTTAAIGKGFAIGSAALVSLALYGAFVVRLGITTGVNILEPLTFSFLLLGAMLPYWFSALTMKSVGEAAGAMVEEVKAQFAADPRLMAGTAPKSVVSAGQARCIDISTKSSLREMVAPSALVMLCPLVAGTFFGVYAVFGLLTGGLVSGVQLAISMSNTGGAWDNAKKFVEQKLSDDPELKKGKGTEVHKAAVVGDTVGDPLKDTSGPALNILMKLMAILSLVFADYFWSINEGRGLFNVAVAVAGQVNAAAPL